MIIACDADGVTCNLHDPWLRRYNEDYGDTMQLHQWTSWNIHELVKPECGKKIYDYLHSPGLYGEVQPIAGALEAIQQLREWGHEIVFTSACSYGMTDQKADWFVRHGFVKDNRPFLPPEFIPVMDKLKIDADLLIDDRAETVRDWVQKKQRHAIMFEYPWNSWLVDAVPSVFWTRARRVTNWRGVLRYVENWGAL